MENCTNCNSDYKRQLGLEPGLCTKCTNLVLNTKEELLKSIKHAVHGTTYYAELKVIKIQREKLNEQDKQQTSMDL